MHVQCDWKEQIERQWERQIKFREFFKDDRNCTERRVQFEVFEKLTSVCFFQIARETILLLVNNIHEKI